MQLVDTPETSRGPGALKISLLLLALASGSWVMGRHASTISDLFISAYLQHYDAATATPGDKLEYFVTSTDKLALDHFIANTTGLGDLQDTRFQNLYTVNVNAATRRTLVNQMRAAPSVSAVFNIPFFCH